MLFGQGSYAKMVRKPLLAVRTLLRSLLLLFSRSLSLIGGHSKVWDTYTGTATLTLAHNHIVRAVDISPKGSHIITGGQEKKLRLFDLEKPDSPTFFVDGKFGDLAHGENIKSVVYDDVNNAIISADDKTLVSVFLSLLSSIAHRDVVDGGISDQTSQQADKNTRNKSHLSIVHHHRQSFQSVQVTRFISSHQTTRPFPHIHFLMLLLALLYIPMEGHTSLVATTAGSACILPKEEMKRRMSFTKVIM